MRYKNNIGPQVRRRRYALGWSQSILAAKLQIAGFDISRSGVSKIEARLSVRGRQSACLSRGGFEGAGSGAFPAADAGKPPLRIHGETGDNEVLNANAASSNPTALGRCSEAGAPYPSGSLKIAEMETQTQAAQAKGGDQERLAYSVQEAADLLGVHYFSVYRLVQRRKLRACRVLSGKLLIPRSELERLLKT